MNHRPVFPLVLFTTIVLLLLLAACEAGQEETPPPPTDVTTTTAVPVTTQEPAPPVALTPGAVETPVPAQQAITLTVWTRPEIVPATGQPGGDVLAGQLDSFDEAHPGLSLRVEGKATTGQGGALSYLRAGRNVAPSILPDLLLLPATQLPDAVAENLVYPLGAGLSPELAAGLFPAAQALSQVAETTYGYPYALINLQHLVYDTATITRTLPTTWSGLLAREDDIRFVFPGVGQDGAVLTLQLYLAAGGALRNEAGQLALQAEPLTVALRQIEQAIATGRILPESASTSNLDQAWQIFQTTSANIVLSNGTTYRQQQNPAGRYDFARLPGIDQSLPLRPGALLWVITTPDPVRQAAALELINWLGAPENLAAWSYAANIVPPSAAALALWPGEDAHASFLARALPDARPFPVAASTTLLTTLAVATENVSGGVQTAAAAAEAAVAALNP
jgi:ABC-type glycerol-3-phosphate transport system substrate-binding protein